jgi:hypothetical protein
MFLGTPRKWWIAAAVPLVLGFVLLATGDGTEVRTAAAVVLLILAMVLFGMAPMHYGRPPIAGRDPSEVWLGVCHGYGD